MKAISFLGPADYKVTNFCYLDQSYETRFFPAAFVQFINAEVLLLCATPTVRGHENLNLLGEELEKLGISWEPLSIPEGHSETDLWSIFDVITEAVEEGESVAFDVTHSFRSLPFLTFLAVAYLKAAKNVHVERVLYGAWEARDKGSNCSPVFDLTPFVSLLDWLTATNRFVETGDGHSLAHLLRSGMPSGIQMGRDTEARILGKNLRNAAEAIEDISLALRVTRPYETMQSSASLEAVLEQARSGIEERARPFSLLAGRVAHEYGQFALDDPTEEEALERSLDRQVTMLNWYIERNHVVQAATLAREWIVSMLALKFNAPMFDLKEGRNEIEQALNNAVRSSRPDTKITCPSKYDSQFQSLPQSKRIISLWSQMSEIRNDIAHVGMRISPRPAKQLKLRVQSFCTEIEKLADEMLP